MPYVLGAQDHSYGKRILVVPDITGVMACSGQDVRGTARASNAALANVRLKLQMKATARIVREVACKVESTLAS